jgi:GAF domain-containing protein
MKIGRIKTMTDPTLPLQEEIIRLRGENEELRQKLDQLQQFVNTLQLLSEASQDKGEGTQEHVEWWLNHILGEITTLLDAPEGSLLLIDGDELVFKLVRGTAQKLLGKRMPIGEGIAGWVAQNRETVVVPYVEQDERFSARMDETSGFETRSIVAAPLVGHGKVLGVVEVINKPGDTPFTDFQAAMLEVFCQMAGTALANMQEK